MREACRDANGVKRKLDPRCMQTSTCQGSTIESLGQLRGFITMRFVTMRPTECTCVHVHVYIHVHVHVYLHTCTCTCTCTFVYNSQATVLPELLVEYSFNESRVAFSNPTNPAENSCRLNSSH